MLSGTADFIASNYYSQLDPEICSACGKCIKRCQFDALKMFEKEKGVKKSRTILFKKNRCVGCGLCVSTCKTKALTLIKKQKEIIPPKTHDLLLDEIMKNKNIPPVKYVKTAWNIWKSRN
jgi:electron transport complex protein RnfB